MRNIFLGLIVATALSACAGQTNLSDSPPVVQDNVHAVVLDTRFVERGIVDMAKETAKSLLALLKPITVIADLPVGF